MWVHLARDDQTSNRTIEREREQRQVPLQTSKSQIKVPAATDFYLLLSLIPLPAYVSYFGHDKLRIRVIITRKSHVYQVNYGLVGFDLFITCLFGMYKYTFE